MDERISFLCKIVNGISEIVFDKEKEKKQAFVEEIYEETKEVYDNFYKILQYAYLEIDDGNMSIDEAMRYFNDERLPFKSARDKIRGYMEHPYYKRNKDLEVFAVGIKGVLCGGLHPVMEMHILPYVIKENGKFIDNVIEFRGYHTVVDLIYRYNRNNENSLFYWECYKDLSDTEKEKIITKRLLNDIKLQIDQIEKSWKIVCEYYPKIMF